MYGYNVGLPEYLLAMLSTQGYVHNNFAQVIFNQYSFTHSSPDELLHQDSLVIYLEKMI